MVTTATATIKHHNDKNKHHQESVCRQQQHAFWLMINCQLFEKMLHNCMIEMPKYYSPPNTYVSPHVCVCDCVDELFDTTVLYFIWNPLWRLCECLLSVYSLDFQLEFLFYIAFPKDMESCENFKVYQYQLY